MAAWSLRAPAAAREAGSGHGEFPPELAHFLQELQRRFAQHEERVQWLLGERLRDPGRGAAVPACQAGGGASDSGAAPLVMGGRGFDMPPTPSSDWHLPTDLPGQLDIDWPLDSRPRTAMTPQKPSNPWSEQLSTALAWESPRRTLEDSRRHVPAREEGSGPAQEALNNGQKSIVHAQVKTMRRGRHVEGCTATTLGGDMKSLLGRVLGSMKFEIFVMSMIILNTLCLGVQVEWCIRHLDEKTPMPFKILEAFFSVVFAVELILRGAHERMTFFSRRNPNLGWNTFDFGIILLSVFVEVMTVAFLYTPNISFMRVFRVLRMFRAFRVLRIMRFFSDVRVMVAGIIRSLQSLVWALLLLAFIMYIIAVCLMQVVRDELHHQRLGYFDLGELDEETLLDYYGTMLRTILTLYFSISGGIDWGDAAAPLEPISSFLVLGLCLYVAFAVFCVLNVITGVFVDNATKLTQRDEESLVHEEMEQRRLWLSDVQKLFGQVDDGSGLLNPVTFRALFEDDAAHVAFSRIGIDVTAVHADSLFRMFDFDGSGQVDMEEFAAGLEMHRGFARRIDIPRLLHEIRSLGKRVDRLASISAAASSLQPPRVSTSAPQRGSNSFCFTEEV